MYYQVEVSMLRRGFTLVELLAVIVILGLILAIAVPRIISLVENSRINAHISNEEMVIRAARNYIGVNEEKLPFEVGETIEISLGYLQDENQIGVIKDPGNRNMDCNGYILITKTDINSFEYAPHLKCGDQNDIGSSSDDGLIAHYKFNDFQEPTENIYEQLRFSKMRELNFEYIGIEDGWMKYSISGVGTDNTYPYSFNIRPMTIHSDYRTSVSFKYKTNVVEKFHDFRDPRMVNIHYKSGFVREDKDMGDYRAAKLENISPLQTTAGVPIIGEANQPIYFLSRPREGEVFDPETDFIYFKDVQVEIKPYATAYTTGFRTGIVKDHSMNNNNINLDINTTPKWVYNEERSSGVYDFNGGMVRMDSGSSISITGNGPRTITGWINTRNGSAGTTQFTVMASHGTSGTDNDFSLGVKENKVSVGYWGTYTEGNTLISNNAWYHITATYDGTHTRIYLNGEYDGGEARVVNTPSGTIKIGNRANDVHTFNGFIDDVCVYNRALTSEEIKLIYNTTKR